MEVLVVTSCLEKNIRDGGLDLPIHDEDNSKDTSSLQDVPSNTDIGESSLLESTPHEEIILSRKNDENICSIITEPVHEESSIFPDGENIKESKEDMASKLNGSVMEGSQISSDILMNINENVERVECEDMINVSKGNGDITDANKGSDQAEYLDGKQTKTDETSVIDSLSCLPTEVASPSKPLCTDSNQIESVKNQEISENANLQQEPTNFLDFSISSNTSPHIKRDKLEAQLGR